MTARAASPYSIGRRLSWQLAWRAVAGLGVLCAAIFAATWFSFVQKQQSHADTKFGSVRAIAIAAASAGGEAEVAQEVQRYAPRRPGTYVELMAADGRTVHRDTGDGAALAKSSHARRTDYSFDAPGIDGGRLDARMWIDTTDDARSLTQLALTLVAATLAGAAWAGFGTHRQVKRGLAPLLELARQTESISPDHLEGRLRLDQPVEELQPWIDQFNGLLGRLERAYVQLEGFNADVAHELRTPLATLIGETEVALSRHRSAEVLRETLSSNLEEVQRLSALVNDMLFLSHADRGARARRGAPTSLARLAAQVADFHEAALAEARLTLAIEGDAVAAVDEPLFKRALSNLLGNATRYAEPGSVVRVRLGADAAQQVEVVVENAGPPVEPQHLPRLFDRFFRAEASRTDAHLHHGLGLAIVAAIARMHAGRTMASCAGGTTAVGFVVPRA